MNNRVLVLSFEFLLSLLKYQQIQAGGQASCMICKAALFSGLEERPTDNCIPACTRPPHMAAMWSSQLQTELCPPPHMLSRAQGVESFVDDNRPWRTPYPVHIQVEMPAPSSFQSKHMGCVSTPGFSLSLCYEYPKFFMSPTFLSS